jgi:predicted nucleic acid-binding protein
VTVVYDAGALVAAERSDRRLWADHRVRLELGIVAITTAPVVAQVSRSGQQVQLRRFLRGCEVMPFESEQGHPVGILAGRSATDDVVDVHLVMVASQEGAAVITSDLDHLSRVAAALPDPVQVLRI